MSDPGASGRGVGTGEGPETPAPDWRQAPRRAGPYDEGAVATQVEEDDHGLDWVK
jgi:hypothetical protein